MNGFGNALGILIFTSQLSAFEGESWPMYLMVIGGLFIIYIFPQINKSIPLPIVAIIITTIISIMTGSDVKLIGEMGDISGGLPKLLIPNVAFNFETLKIILPYSISLAFVGLIESVLTAQILDDMTQTSSDKNQECLGQGVGNIVVGFLGGMAGCAMIGQSVVNIKTGGRGRLSTLMTGVYLMILILTLNTLVVQIPVAALVSVMIMIAIATFGWDSITLMHKTPKLESLIMIVTVVVVLVTHNLAIGVLVGVILDKIICKKTAK